MTAITSAFSALAFYSSAPHRPFCSFQTNDHHYGRPFQYYSPRSLVRCRPNVDDDFAASRRNEPHPAPPPPSAVRVYDGVFSPSACLELVEIAEDHSYRATNSEGSSVFSRRPPSASDDERIPLTPLERALDSILTTLGDESPWVEYWSRMEHLNMDAHADIDEELLEDGDDLTGEKILRCPTTGHVLYLDVEDEVRGPTCVFPDRLVGWDGDAYNEDGGADRKSGGNIAEGRNNRAVSMVTVPAVQGRLLRFDGRAMHAVPRPANRWLLLEHEERALRQFEETGFDEDCDSDEIEWIDEDERSDDPVRAVLLFNTWADPPRGVDRDPVTGAPPSGIEIVGDDSAEDDPCYADGNDDRLACQDVSDWVEVPILPSDLLECEAKSDERVPVRVNLMGSRERRVHPSKYAELSGPGLSLKTALLDASQPSIFVLSDLNESP